MGIARIAILAVAIIAAGVAAFLVSGMLSKEPVQVTQNVVDMPTTEVLVAAEGIHVGKQITRSDLRWQPWPEDAIEGPYIVRDRRPDAVENFSDAVARVALLKGEPVTDSKIVKFEDAGFMAAMLRPGMRAASVRISPESGAGGFILPNDRVDVILTRKAPGKDGFESETILTNVRVLAIDQSFSEQEDEQVAVGKTATLELTSEQAEVLALAEAMGDLSLALRSLADTGADGDAGPQMTTVLRGTRKSQGHAGQDGSVTVIRYGVPVSVTPNSLR